MYLKSLKLAGFKSFADRTRLELEPGVTVVVGPNGSGKSNVVDALGWVMGTQSPSAMRTQKMEDVIFAGTATRPALGRAEVTLVFDNASGQLPLDLAEVAITRRLYRDGSSDYEINGAGCRLLDIQELLSDSGVGRQQHILVGQGQITSILTAKPDDHRAVIEEAAGILKHRLRKDRSIRRLERTADDVVRLEDILHELKRQIRPLKRQAQNAARHDSVRDELRALRLWLAGEELRTIDARLGEVGTAEGALATTQASAEASIAAVEPTLVPLREQVGEIGQRLDRTTEAAARLEVIGERVAGTIQLTRERHRSLRARLEGAGERREDLTQEAEELRRGLEATETAEREARQEAERAERELRGLEDQERALAEQESLPTEGAAAMVRGDLRSLEAAAERDGRELAQLVTQRDRLVESRAAAHEEITTLEKAVETKGSAVEHRAAALADAAAAEERAEAEWDSADQARREADARVVSLSSRKEAIEAVVAGLADPRAAAKARRSGGDLGTVTEVLDIPTSLAAAVDAALGQWQGAIVFDGSDSLARATADLKGDGLGGLPLVTGDEAGDIPAADVAREEGVETLVSRLGPHALGTVAARLLGDVIVVAAWQSGWEIVRRHPQIRAVTPDGDLITSGGIRLVDPEGATPAMLEAAGSALELAEAERVDTVSWERQAREAREGARLRRRSAEQEHRRSIDVLEETSRALERARHRESDAAAGVERTAERISFLEEGEGVRAAQIEELRARLAALEGEEAERQAAWDELSRRRQEVATLRDEARRTRQEREKELGGLVERGSMLRRRLEVVEREALDLAQTSFDPDALDRLDRLAEVGQQALALIKGHIEVLRSDQAKLREAAGEAGLELDRRREQLAAATADLSEARERLGLLAIERTELTMRREGVCEALRRDADAEEDLALAAPEPASEGEQDHGARAASLEASLRRMGPINPLAAQEFAELDERRQFMEEQLADLEESRSEIRKVIRALDEEIEGLFLGAFGKVADAFAEHVGILFPGGRGELVLTDPDHPLTTGIDIKVQPLGKKISRLSLLSGGEKSMAALAFLFAVFRAAPSPFYVLDEVEAALDDANLRRFLDLVEAFRGTSQLIIVTHQQQTMEAADMLYGVTMEPGGSTKVIAKKMVDQMELAES